MMTDSIPFLQPGDPDQLAKVVLAAEKYYEESRRALVVFWDAAAERYRLDYEYRYDGEGTIEVVRIPK
jgi:hypothetical protein